MKKLAAFVVPRRGPRVGDGAGDTLEEAGSSTSATGKQIYYHDEILELSVIHSSGLNTNHMTPRGENIILSLLAACVYMSQYKVKQIVKNKSIAIRVSFLLFGFEKGTFSIVR